jgi:hypothetical protein
MCIIGCGRTYIRESGTREVGMKEDKREETDMREVVTKEADISPANLLEIPIKEEADKRKNGDKQSILYDEVGIASFISDEY